MVRRDSVSIVQEHLKDFWDSDVEIKKPTEESSFNIVWRITNFSMCKLQKGECLESPTFVSECLQNTNWYLRLYPKGQFDSDDVLCYLVRGNISLDGIKVRYKLSVGTFNQCIDEVQTFEKYSQSTLPAHANRNKILNDFLKYPLVDILMVDCHIWNHQGIKKEIKLEDKSLALNLHNHENNADSFPKNIQYSTVDEMEALKRKLRPYPGSCSAYTRIPVVRWYFLWCINKFSKRQSWFEHETITVISVSENAPKILMTFFVNEEGYLELNIRELTGKYTSPFTVNCKIQLIGIHDRNFEFPLDIHLFSSDEIWKIVLNRQSFIVEQEDRFLLDDKLTLRCELAISYEKETSNIDSCSYIPDNQIKLKSKRQIAHKQTITQYLNTVWYHIKFASVICVISFLLAFMYDVLI